MIMEATTTMTRLLPFNIGNKTADGIFPDKNRFMALHAATQIPLTTPTIAVVRQIFDAEPALFTKTRPYLF